MRTWEGEEVRAHFSIEDMDFQRVQYRWNTSDDDGLIDFSHEIFGQHRQALDTVQVGVAEQHMSNTFLLFQRQGRRHGSRVHHERPVDQKSAAGLTPMRGAFLTEEGV